MSINNVFEEVSYKGEHSKRMICNIRIPVPGTQRRLLKMLGKEGHDDLMEVLGICWFVMEKSQF